MITETVILATSVGVFVKRRIRGGVRFWQNLLELEDIKRENKKLKTTVNNLKAQLTLMEGRKNALFAYAHFLEEKFCINPGDTRIQRVEFLMRIQSNKKTEPGVNNSETIESMA
ncbi:MAG: hypothetical protein UT53_C0038G0003 [Candidatus Yanofskybacteria bacterium GW2011_GWD2_39_48]|uniref:Uncharacterized protein n=1 Tax=Candidatus Yanofskybacteria bacterium GW2011_GWD2_39_48 TaxID=1619031 RepID=A0A0G0P2Q7_9BACT|nr:MAG: hypothetical protein UT53_C0038G0003 [Candidatus Yanofskybacteria bacterium GW2011_GWD2_39_48]